MKKRQARKSETDDGEKQEETRRQKTEAEGRDWGARGENKRGARWRKLVPKGIKEPGHQGQDCALCPGQRPAEVGWTAPPTSTRSPSRGQDGASHLGSPAALAAPTASRSGGTTHQSEPGARTPGPAGPRPPGLLPPPGRGLGQPPSHPPLPGGACESTRPAERGGGCEPRAPGSANAGPPPADAAFARRQAAAGLRGSVPALAPHRAKSSRALGGGAWATRSRPGRCSPALDATASPGARGDRPRVRAGLPPAGWAATDTAPLWRRENLPNFRGTVRLPRCLLSGEMAALRQTTVSSVTSQKAKVSGNLRPHGGWHGRGSEDAPGGGREWLLSGRHSWQGSDELLVTGEKRWQRVSGHQNWCDGSQMWGPHCWSTEGVQSRLDWGREVLEGPKGKPAPSPCSFLPPVTQSRSGCPWGAGDAGTEGDRLCAFPQVLEQLLHNKVVKKKNYGKSEGGKAGSEHTLEDPQSKTFLLGNMETRHQIPNVSIYIAVVKEKLGGKFVAKNGYVGGKMVKINELIINLKYLKRNTKMKPKENERENILEKK